MSLASRLLLLTQRIAAVFNAVRNRLVISRAVTSGETVLPDVPLDVRIQDDYGFVFRFRSASQEYKTYFTDDGGINFFFGSDSDASSTYLLFAGRNTNLSVRHLVQVLMYSEDFTVTGATGNGVSTFDTARAQNQPTLNSDLTRKDYVDSRIGAVQMFTATVTVPYSSQHSAVVNHVDASITPASKIMCSLIGQNEDAENEFDELEGMNVYAIPKTGAIDFYITAFGAFGGEFKIQYTIGV